MNKIGFSSGSIAKSDYKFALNILNEYKEIEAIELSALRENELEGLVNDLNILDLTKYSYVSIHAPSSISNLTESKVIDLLENILQYKYNIIVHPDIIKNFDDWKIFGKYLCIENMDKRKATGRTLRELNYIFDKLPDASLCFDIAHAYQVDPSLIESIDILKVFKSKLKQIHLSEVNSESKHETLSMDAVLAFHHLSEYVPQTLPIIIESILKKTEIKKEILITKFIFSKIKNFNSKEFKHISNYILDFQL